MTNQTTLRDVEQNDLAIFFQQQLSAEANLMAAFTAKDPTDEEAFLDRWRRILADKTIYAQTIMVGKHVVGYVLHHSWFGEPELTYWIDPRFWGKGIGTEAVRQFLEKADTRPLNARIAEDNFGSRRVLEKNGFVYSGEETDFAEARGHDIKEIIYVVNSRAN